MVMMMMIKIPTVQVNKSWKSMVDEWAIPVNLPPILRLDMHDASLRNLSYIESIFRTFSGHCVRAECKY